MPARREAKTSARTVGKLTRTTGEGTDDLVLVLARTTDAQDRVWLQVRLPIRPNGTTGWVPESALSELQPVDTWLRITTKTYKATVVKNGKRVFSANVGVGQPQWPTPRGQFYIRAKLTGYNNPALRAAGVHHQRDLGHADRLAGRRDRRRPRHEPAGADPGPHLARLRADAQRRHPEAEEADRRSARRSPSPDPLRGAEAVRRIDLALDPAQPRQVRAVVGAQGAARSGSA